MHDGFLSRGSCRPTISGTGSITPNLHPRWTSRVFSCWTEKKKSVRAIAFSIDRPIWVTIPSNMTGAIVFTVFQLIRKSKLTVEHHLLSMRSGSCGMGKLQSVIIDLLLPFQWELTSHHHIRSESKRSSDLCCSLSSELTAIVLVAHENYSGFEKS